MSNLNSQVSKERVLKWSLFVFFILVLLAVAVRAPVLLRILPIFGLGLLGLLIYFLVYALTKPKPEAKENNNNEKQK